MRVSGRRGLRWALGSIVLVPLLVVGLVVGAHAGKPPRLDRTVAAEIDRVDCTAGGPRVTYKVTSGRSTVDVEVRWRVYTGKILEIGGTYALQKVSGLPTNTWKQLTAPSGYTFTSVTVVPLKNNGRTGGTTASAAVSCR